MTKEAYVSFEIAKLLKEKEFDEEVNWYYDSEGFCEPCSSWVKSCPHDYYPMPTHQMACAWLRNKEIIIDILAQSNKTTSPEYMFNIWDYSATQWNKHICEYQPAFVEQEFDFTTYEDAVEAALKYSLENLL